MRVCVCIWVRVPFTFDGLWPFYCEYRLASICGRLNSEIVWSRNHEKWTVLHYTHSLSLCVQSLANQINRGLFLCLFRTLVHSFVRFLLGGHRVHFIEFKIYLLKTTFCQYLDFYWKEQSHNDSVHSFSLSPFCRFQLADRLYML